MKKKKVLIAALLPLSLTLSHNAFAEDTVPVTPVTVAGGTVQFTGSITDAPCVVNASTEGQPVELGQYRSADFSKAGDTTSPKNFNISLSSCAVDTYSKASVTFRGVTAAGDNTTLSTDGGSGAATGVGIQILKNNVALAVDGSGASEATSLIEGSNNLTFQAQYIAKAARVTPGQANASADFTITYL
ncbi:fimbrial protein [Pantoea sp.]|uniref:fimbrial protein n=1 Tax=Pantoea TaxID=53335 RepID=UPI0028AD9635|nr:fimbrial protein [Pantoea sp.]